MSDKEQILAICGAGQQASVVPHDWVAKRSDYPYDFAGVGKEDKVEKAICVPVKCRLKDRCTRKVLITRPPQLADKVQKATIIHVRFADGLVQNLINPDMPI